MKSSEYRKLVGERIRQARMRKGWRAKDVLAAMGHQWDASRLSNYEAGARIMENWEAQLLANVLGVRASWLLCLDEGQLVLTPEEEQLLRYWRALPENERAAVATEVEVKALRYLKPVSDERLSHFSAADKRRARHRTK